MIPSFSRVSYGPTVLPTPNHICQMWKFTLCSLCLQSHHLTAFFPFNLWAATWRINIENEQKKCSPLILLSDRSEISLFRIFFFRASTTNVRHCAEVCRERYFVRSGSAIAHIMPFSGLSLEQRCIRSSFEEWQWHGKISQVHRFFMFDLLRWSFGQIYIYVFHMKEEEKQRRLKCI